MAEFDVEDLVPDDAVADKVREMLTFVRQRLEEGELNYRFIFQMLGDSQKLPSKDALAVIIAKGYAEHMRNWDGNDMFLPMMFAELTVREMTRND